MKLNQNQLDTLLDAVSALAEASACQALVNQLDQSDSKKWHADKLVTDARQGLFDQLAKLELL